MAIKSAPHLTKGDRIKADFGHPLRTVESVTMDPKGVDQWIILFEDGFHTTWHGEKYFDTVPEIPIPTVSTRCGTCGPMGCVIENVCQRCGCH